MIGKKPNIAIFTSATAGLAHYAAHMYEPLKKYTNPFFITYADTLIDDLVVDKVDKIYPLIRTDSAASVLMILRFLKDKNIKIIYFNVGTTVRKHTLYYLSLLSQAKLAGIKIIGMMHDVVPFESFYVDPASLGMLYSVFDHYIVGNQAEADKLKLYFQIEDKDTTKIKHGPYTLFDNHRFTKESAREELQIPKDKKVILFFGSLKPHKGLKYLIKALKKIIKNVPNAWLYISTDINYSPQLNEFITRIEKSGVAKHIQLVKQYVPSSKIEPLFKAADVIALPYTQVSQSGILSLAQAFSRAVVVTDIFPSASKIDRFAGRVAKKEDVDSLVRAITDVLSISDSKLNDMGKNGYNMAIENSWEYGAKKILTIIKKVNK